MHQQPPEVFSGGFDFHDPDGQFSGHRHDRLLRKSSAYQVVPLECFRRGIPLFPYPDRLEEETSEFSLSHRGIIPWAFPRGGVVVVP